MSFSWPLGRPWERERNGIFWRRRYFVVELIGSVEKKLEIVKVGRKLRVEGKERK